MSDLQNKTAIVTGAAQGIGFEIARELIEGGVNLVLNDIDETLLQQAGKKLSPTSDHVQLLHGDASRTEVIDGMVRQAVSSFGQLDFVIANAGITIPGSFLEFSEQNLRKMLDLNLIGSFLLAQAAARQMIRQNSIGRILFMSSVTGIQAVKGTEAYGMTKAGLRMLAKTLAVELAPHGITVNCVAPGATETERTLQNPNYSSAWSRFIPTGRAATTSDIAKACIFLLSADSRQITGQTLIVDGGWSLTGATPDQI